MAEFEPKKISVIIPTLQRDVTVLNNLIASFLRDDAVGEILVIDNSTKGFNYNDNRVRVIVPQENMFVNPSWNYGVENSKYEYIALANDDIKIPDRLCTRVLEKITDEIGIIGMSSKNVIDTRDKNGNVILDISTIELSEAEEIKLEPTEFRTLSYGVLMFFKKTSYVEIPNELKIFFGDDWIIEQAKKLGKQNAVAAGANIYHLGSLSSGEFTDFGRNEKKIFFKHLIPFHKRIFSIYKSYTHTTYFILFMSFAIRRKNANSN